MEKEKWRGNVKIAGKTARR